MAGHISKLVTRFRLSNDDSAMMALARGINITEASKMPAPSGWISWVITSLGTYIVIANSSKTTLRSLVSIIVKQYIDIKKRIVKTIERNAPLAIIGREVIVEIKCSICETTGIW